MWSLKIEDSNEYLKTWSNIATDEPKDSDEPEDVKPKDWRCERTIEDLRCAGWIWRLEI